MKRWHLILLLSATTLGVLYFYYQDLMDFFYPPSPRTIYARDFEKENPAIIKWTAIFENAKKNPTTIATPYAEKIKFSATNQIAISYTLDLYKGEELVIEIKNKDDEFAVFLDILRSTSLKTNQILQKIIRRSADISPEQSHKQYDTQSSEQLILKKPGRYKAIVQPPITAASKFEILFYKRPTYVFPVIGASNRNMQSFWGAPRAGGKRSHEGIDIFASRGTPVVAVTNGFISSTGERGLGGKQVWLRDGLFGQSVYYAHLDSIATTTTSRVQAGDTLGFVGNTGNAKSTPPHLHFGIYTTSGAIDPLLFIKERMRATIDFKFALSTGIVKQKTALTRSSPSLKSKAIGSLKRNDSVNILGTTKLYYRVLSDLKKQVFIQKTAIREVE